MAGKARGAGKASAHGEAKRTAFLNAFAKGLAICEAAGVAGISRASPSRWRKIDKNFARRYDEALVKGAAYLGLEANRRAVEGVKKPLIHKGLIVMWDNPETGRREPFYMVEQSDTLLMFLMKSRNPQLYDDRVRFEMLMRKWRKRDEASGDGDTPAEEIVNLLAKIAAEKVETLTAP